MSLRCLIVDDEPLARKIIKDYIREISDLECIGEMTNAIDAFNFLNKNRVDLIFLDINMPNLSGLNLVRQLKEKPLIIFTTAHPEFAVEAFEVEAFDYLVKPISFDRFLKTCNKALLNNSENINSEAQFIAIKENKRYYRVNINDIYYLKAFGDYIRIFSKEKTYITKETLAGFSQNLNDRFVQVHRSYIINIDHVEYMEGNHVLINTKKIPVSKSYREELRDKFK